MGCWTGWRVGFLPECYHRLNGIHCRASSGGTVKVEGSYTFDAPRDRVWSMLMNPDALKNCVPGCESLVSTGENAYDATLKVGVAAIRGTYKSTIKLTDLEEP